MAHVVGELDPVVVSYEVSADDWREVSRVPSTAVGPAYPSEIDTSPDGRFLYVGNRGADTVAVFGLNDGLPQPVAEVSAGGAWPRHFVAFSDLLYVANERSQSVVVDRRTVCSTRKRAARGRARRLPASPYRRAQRYMESRSSFSRSSATPVTFVTRSSLATFCHSSSGLPSM